MKLAELAGLDVQAFSRVVRHTDAHSGGTGAMMFRDDMSKPLAPDHFLYQPFLHTRELGEKDLSLALGLGGKWEWTCRWRGSLCKTWPKDWAYPTPLRPNLVDRKAWQTSLEH